MVQRVSGRTRGVVDCLPGVADGGLATCSGPFSRVLQGRTVVGYKRLEHRTAIRLGRWAQLRHLNIPVDPIRKLLGHYIFHYDGVACLRSSDSGKAASHTASR